MKDKKGQQLHIGDVIREDIYTIIGEKIGSVLSVIKNSRKDGVVKEIIADNGGVGYLIKGNRGKVKEGKNEHITRIGYNYRGREI